jgi:hypothetical protein
MAYPREANRRAVAAPIPLDPPVMTATAWVVMAVPSLSLGACFLRGSLAAHFDEMNAVSVPV